MMIASKFLLISPRSSVSGLYTSSSTRDRAFDEVHQLARHARVRRAERQQLRRVVVSRALFVAWPRFVFLDQLVVNGRLRPQIPRVVPFRGRKEYRDVGARDVTGNHHLRPSFPILAEVGELALGR